MSWDRNTKIIESKALEYLREKLEWSGVFGLNVLAKFQAERL